MDEIFIMKGKNSIGYTICLLVLLSFPCFGKQEVEPNDTFYQPNFVLNGETVTGKLDQSGDMDWYKVNTEGNSSIEINLSLTNPKKVTFPFNLSAWKVLIYDPIGNLVDEEIVDLVQDEIIVERAIEKGDYLVAIKSEGYASDEEYNLSINKEIIEEPLYSDFSGVWDTGTGYYISVHQTLDEVIFAILYGNFQSWDVQYGVVKENTVNTTTLSGAVSIEFNVKMTTPNTLEAIQVSCEPITEECAFPDGHKFEAVRILH